MGQARRGRPASAPDSGDRRVERRQGRRSIGASRRRRGVSAIEYCLLSSVIAIVCIGAVQSVGENAAAVFDGVFTSAGASTKIPAATAKEAAAKEKAAKKAAKAEAKKAAAAAKKAAKAEAKKAAAAAKKAAKAKSKKK